MSFFRNKISYREGSVILWTMLFLSLFFLTISTVAVVTILEIRQSSKIDSSSEAYLLAEAGADRAKNFANNGEAVSKTGTIDGNQYVFEVVKADAGTAQPFDNRTCDNTSSPNNKYCYFSQATVGSIRRKIDGAREEIPILQGKAHLQGYVETFAATPSNSALLYLPGAIPTDPTKFYLSWKIENVNGCTNGLCFATGLVDSAAPWNDWKLLEVYTKKSGTETKIDFNATRTGVPRLGAQTMYIPGTDVNAYFEITYMRGGTATLKVTGEDASGVKKCRGVLVRNNINDIWGPSSTPYYMAFYRNNQNVFSGPSFDANYFGVDMQSDSHPITVRGVFFRVE